MAAFAVVVVAGFWVLLIAHLRQERDLAIQDSFTRTSYLARAFEEHVVRTIKDADQAVLTLRAEYQRKGARIDIPALQRSGIMASPLFARVNIVGPDGYLLAANVPFKRTYVGDREHVYVHMEADGGELHIGKPVIGRATEGSSILLRRRINAPDGSLAGVAAVALDPNYFAGFYESIRIGSGAVIMLVGRDGVVRAAGGASPKGPRLGEDLSGNPLFKRVATGNAGSYLDPGEADGVARVVSFSALADYPLIVSVAMAEEEALAGFYARRSKYYLGAAVFSALALALSGLLIRAFRRQGEIAKALREREAQRAEAEESLRRSEARFRTLFERAPMAIVVVSPEAAIIDANSAYLKLFGFDSIEEARGLNPVELYDPSQRQEVEAFHQRWCNGEAIEHRWERVRMRRDGTRFHAEVHAMSMQFPAGPVGVGFIVDISQRKRMQQEMQRAKDRLELAVRGAQLAIVDIDCATRIATVNDPCAAIGSAKAGEYELCLRDMQDMVHPEDSPRVIRQFIDMLNGDEPNYAAHHRIRDAKDGWRWISWRATVVERDASGRAVRVAGTAADVSAYKRAEEVLRRTETKLSLVAANVPGMVFQMTYRAGQFFFHYVSPGSAALLGLAPEALRADPGLFLEAIGKGDRSGLEESLLAAAESFQTWSWEGRAGGPNGELRWIQMRATPSLAFYGKILWDGIAIDVTKIKEHEQALQETKRQLRELAAHNEAIREQERARIARELHDELGQLLTGLKLSLSAMTEGEDAPQQAFDKAQNARVTYLVEQAIAVTRNAVMDLRPPALDHGLGAAVAWLADQFVRRTGIPCSVDLPDHEIELDERRATAFFRILQESLTNVAKHADATRVRIKLAADRDSVRMQVTDDGKGFSEKDAGTTRGFGLLGMRERVAMLGGSIHIASSSGQGTTVHVEITQERKAA